MKSKECLLISAFCSLIGCAHTSDIVPIGNGAYEVTGSSATALASGGSQKIKLLKTANEFCGKQGKQMSLVSADANGGHVGSAAVANGSAYGPGGGATFHAQAVHPGTAANADVIFRCE